MSPHSPQNVYIYENGEIDLNYRAVQPNIQLPVFSPINMPININVPRSYNVRLPNMIFRIDNIDQFRQNTEMSININWPEQTISEIICENLCDIKDITVSCIIIGIGANIIMSSVKFLFSFLDKK